MWGGEMEITGVDKSCKKEKKRNPLHKHLVAGSLCCIAFYGFAQIVTPTEAKFVSVKQVDGTFATAFVFPKKINDIANQAKVLQEELESYLVNESFSTSEQGQKVVAALGANRGSFVAARNELTNLLSEIHAYNEEAKRNVEEVSTQIQLYKTEETVVVQAKLDAMIENQGRALHIQEYVGAGYSEVVTINKHAKTVSDFDSLLSNLQARVQELKAAEEKVRLEKLKKEEEEKKKAEQVAKEKAEKEKAEKEKQSKNEQPPTTPPSEPSQQESSPPLTEPAK
jgi:hypothetical protein